ncbi:hypothetical protein GHT09_010101 [Marmota monax]|uniref:Kinase non-catalytic C-lobe domain-containing protein 1 n=1 Tax=Marmota monax TaxID=9995 RepID=A0A834QIQ6_MARMO|nr:hypothetical protein GHT09_010101 [Marmota monax]
MQAMDPAASFYEEEGKDLDFYDFEPLPTLPEDEENVSLADILSLRDSGLSEQEAWAVCLECSLSMRSVAHAAIFQTLCITPDTLAFNTSGNVCFMEQLSDDPEGAFVPPEFDLTGNTFEAHIYSLGATLKAALEYVAESELEPKLSPDLEALLSQMQAEDPRDRPDLESIIALCEEKVQPGSSCRLCRSLSAVGRRVLSIESFGAFQDVGENTWKGRPASRSSGPRRPPGDSSTGPEALPTPESLPQPTTHEDPEQEAIRGPRPPPTRPLLSAPMKNGENPGREGLASLVLDSKCPLHELDKDFLRRSLRKVQTFPRLLPKGPEASALCFSLSSPRNHLSVSELFPPDPKVFLEGKNGLPSFKAQPQSRLWSEQEPRLQLEGAPGAGLRADRGLRASGQQETPLPGQEPAEESPRPCPTEPGDAGREAQTPGDVEGIPGGARQPEKAATEQCPGVPRSSIGIARPCPRHSGSLAGAVRGVEVALTCRLVEVLPQGGLTGQLCPPQSLSLQDLLCQLGRPFREYELWALCLACLRALQSHSQHPACLCLDNVLVAEDGAVLFGPPPDNGKEKVVAARGSGGPCSPTTQLDRDSDILSQGNFEVGFRPQKSIKAAREGQPEVNGQQVPGPEPASRASDMDTVARLARPKERGPAGSLGPAEFRSCSPGWSSAFYEADCFGADVHNYVKGLGMRKASGHPEPEAESPELEQHLLVEKRNYRKTWKFYQKLLQKEKRNKGSEVKTMLSKLRGQLEEMKAKVQFLSLVKKYLQVMYAERWGLEPCALPVIVNIAAAPCDTLDFSPLDASSSLIFYNVNKPPRGGRQQKARILQAGTPLGLMAYLYSSDAFLEGYVQQFLYTFRYFCTPQDFLHFLLDRISSTLSRAHEDPTSTFTKIYRRSLCVLQAWVEDCYTVDFTRNAGLLGRLEDFISSKILPLDGSAEHLLGLLEVGTDRRADGSPRSTDLEDPKEAEEDTRPFNALCKRFSEDGISRKSFSWRLPRGNGLTLPHHRERQYTIASALPKPCFFEDFYGPYTKASGKGSYFLTEYSTHQLFTQLTLLQQELFQKCHPVHFLNSRALGVMDTSGTIPKASSSESLSAQTCSLFLPSYIQDKYLLQLLRNADDVSTWVAAEIVTSHTSKLQVNVLSKFLLVAKSCYEQRNFATAMQILGGLENLAAWRMLPAKIAEVLEELKAVEVFLKSDSLCLMEGRRFRAQPTLPSARLLAMHIQQLETGGFTMTNGAHRWSKLRNIAKVVSQVHAFQENPYTFSPDPKLQSHLKQRIARFSGADIAILAADNRAKLHQVPSEKHSRKIQDKLRRMKATFQ